MQAGDVFDGVLLVDLAVVLTLGRHGAGSLGTPGAAGGDPLARRHLRDAVEYLSGPIGRVASIFIQRENPGVYPGRESRHGGTFLPAAPGCTPNRGGTTAPMSGQSDNFGIPTRLLQGIPCGSGEDTDKKQQGTSESPMGEE